MIKMSLIDAIKDNNLEQFKAHLNEVQDKDRIEWIKQLIKDVMNNDSFAILEYLIENYYLEYIELRDYMRSTKFYIVKPTDVTSYEYSKYIVTKALLNKYDIPCTIYNR
jgi:hypothetical protein